MTPSSWSQVVAHLRAVRDAIDRDGDPTPALGPLVDAVRRWHAEQADAVTVGLAGGPRQRLAAARAEEHLQRVDELMTRIWSLATGPQPCSRRMTNRPGASPSANSR